MTFKQKEAENHEFLNVRTPVLAISFERGH